MALPLNLAAQVYNIFASVSAGNKYYYLELRLNYPSQRTINIPGNLITSDDETKINNIFGAVQEMKDNALLTIGSLPVISLYWNEELMNYHRPITEEVMRDRQIMGERNYLIYALRCETEETEGINPAAFCTRWNITRDFLLSSLQSFQKFLDVSIPYIPITWTDKGFINMSAVTQAQILSLADYFGSSPIYTFIVLHALKSGQIQTVNGAAIFSTWKLPSDRLNAHLLAFQDKTIIDFIPGQITITWLNKLLDAPTAEQLIARRSKVYSEAGYVLYALAIDGRLSMPTTELMTRWNLTEEQLFTGLEALRKNNFLSYGVTSSIKWL